MGKNATITIKTIFEKANTSAIVNQIKKDKEAIEKAGTTNVPVNFDFNNKDFNAALQNLNKGLTAKNMAGLDFSKQMMEVIQLMSSPNMAIEEKTSEINKIAESFKLISSSKGGFITAQDRELFKQMNSNQLSRVMEEIAKIRDEEVRNTKLKEQNDIYKYSKYYDLGNGDEKVGSNFYNALLKGKVYDRIEGKEEADPLIPKTKLKPQRTTIGAFGNDLGINYNKALERALSEHREDLSAEDIAKSKDVIEKRIKEYGTIIRRIEETFETFNDLHEKTDFESMTKKAGLIRRMGALYSIAEEQEKNLKKLDNKANANGAIGIDETKFFTKAEEGEFADIRKNIISTIGSNSLNRKDITALFNDVRKEIQDSFLSEDTPELAAAKQHYRDFISTYAKTTVARVTTAAAEILDGELASASNKQITPDASSQTGQAVQSIEKPIEEAIPKIDLVHSTNLKKEDIEIDDPKELIKQINDISAELDKSLYPTKGKPTAPSQELLYKYKALIGRAEYLNDKLSKQGISSFDKQFDEIFDKDYEYFENFFDPDKKNEIIGSAQREVMEDLYANASKNAIGPFLRKNFSPLPTDAELKKFESVQSKGEPPKESELKAEEVISTKVDEKLDKATESAEKTTEELNQMAEKLKESEENAKSLQKNLDDLGDEYSKLNEEKKKVENDLSTAQKNKDDLENKIRKVTGAGTDEDLNTLLSKIEKVDTSEKANLTQEEFDKFVDEREAFKKTKKDQAHYEKEAVKKDQAINDAQAKIEELEGQISQLKETINAGNQSRKEQLGDVAKYNSFELAKEKAIRHSKGNTEEQDFNRRQYLDEHIKEFYEHGGDINNDTHLYQLYKSGLIYHTIQEEYLNQGKVPPNYEYQGKDVTKLLTDAYEKGEEILKNKNNSVDELNKTNEVINNLRAQISDYESQIKTLKKDIEDLNKSKKALENDAKTIEKTTTPKVLVKEPKKVKESTPVTATPTSEDESVVVPARKTTTTSKTAVVHSENAQRAAVKTTVPRITSGATSGEIAAETEAVEALFQIINEVTSAVNKKTDAFKTENTTVSKVVNSEKTKLEELKTTLSEIKETLGESLAAAPIKGTAGKTIEQQAEALVKAVSSSLNKIPISFETKTALKELQTALKSERAEIKIIPDTTGFKKKIQDSVKSPVKLKTEPISTGFTKELQKAVKGTPIKIEVKPLADAFAKDLKKLAGTDAAKALNTVKGTGKKKEEATVEISVKAIKEEIKTLKSLSEGINKLLERYNTKRSSELKGIIEYLTEVAAASEKTSTALAKAFSGKSIDKQAIKEAVKNALDIKPVKVKLTPDVKDFMEEANNLLRKRNIKIEVTPVVKNFEKNLRKSIPESQRECRVQVKPNTNSMIADIKRALRKNDFSIKITGTVNEINSVTKDKQFVQKKNDKAVKVVKEEKTADSKSKKSTMADREFNKNIKSSIDSQFKASEEIARANLNGNDPDYSMVARYKILKKNTHDLLKQAKEEGRLADEQIEDFEGYIKEKRRTLRSRLKPDIEESVKRKNFEAAINDTSSGSKEWEWIPETEPTKALKESIDKRYAAKLGLIHADFLPVGLVDKDTIAKGKAEYYYQKRWYELLLNQSKTEGSISERDQKRLEEYLTEKDLSLAQFIQKGREGIDEKKQPNYEVAKSIIAQKHKLETEIGKLGTPQTEAQAKKLAELNLELEKVDENYSKLFTGNNHKYIGDPFKHTEYKKALKDFDATERETQEKIVNTVTNAAAEFNKKKNSTKEMKAEYEAAEKTIKEYYNLKTKIGEMGIPQSETQAKQLGKLKLQLKEVTEAYNKLFDTKNNYIGNPFDGTNLKDSLINLNKEKASQQKEIVETANDASAKFYSTEKVKLKDLETLIRQYERIVDNTLSEKGKLNSVEALLDDVNPKKNPAGPTKEFYRENKTYTPEGAAIANSRLKALTDLRDKYKEPNIQAKIVDEYKDSCDVIEKFRQKDSIYKMADMRKVAQEADRITKYIEANSRISAESKNKLIGHTETLQQALKGSDFSAAQLKEIQKQFYNIDVAERKAGRTGHSFFDILNTKARYLSASILSFYFSWMGIMDFFRKGFETIKEFDSALTEMQKVSNESLNTLKEYQSTSFELGSAIGTTGLQIQQSTADWQRLGESLTEASKSAQASNVLFNVSEFNSIDEATQSLVAMSSAYEDVSKNIDKMDIVDKLNQVGNDFSISTDGIATALQDSASSLKTAGDDIDESIALITAGNAVTQDPEKVGSGLRTISLRLNGTTLDKKALEEAGEDTDGMIETQSKLRKSIMAATKVASNDYKGFDIMDENGNYKSTYQKLLGLSDIWKEIKEHDKESGTNNANFILETIAGKNRSNIAASILDNPEILKNAYQESKNSKGSALRENEKQMESIEGHLTKLSNAWQKMWASASNRNTINNILNFSTAIVNLISKVGLLKTSLITAFGTSFIKGLFKGNSLVLSLAESLGKLHLALKSVIETKNVSSIFEKPKSFIENVKSGWEKYINAIKKGQAVPADKVDEAETEVANTAVKERLTIEREKAAAAAKQEAEAIGEVAAAEKVEIEAEVENTGANEVGNVVEEQEIANLEAETKGQLEVAAAEKIEDAAEKEGTLGNTVKNVASNVGKNATIEAGETVTETAGKSAAAGGISAGTIIAGGAIAGAAIAGIAGVYAFDKLTVSEKEAEEGAKAVMNAYSNAESTFNQHKNTISEIGDRFEQLQRGVSETGKNLTLSSGDYKEYLELSNQIADMYPDLVSGYDAQGNAIVRLKGNVDSLNDALREEQKAAANVIIHGNEETGGKSADEILEDYKHKANTTSVWDKVGGVLINNAPGGTFSESAATKAEKKLLKLLNEKGKISYAEAGEAVGDASILTYIQKNTMGIGNGNGGAYNSWTNMNKKDLQELKTFLETDIQSNQTTENESLNNLKTLLNAYAVENDSYGKLNDSSISLINSTINSITEKFAKDHKFDKGKGNKAEIINYTNELVEGVLNAQTKNPDVINALFGDAPINLKNKSLIEAQKTVDKYKKALDPYIGSYNTSILFKNLGIEDYGKEADKVQRKIKELAGNSSDDLNKLTQATKNFSYDEAEAFLEAAAGTDSASEALKKFYQLQAENAAQAQTSVIDYQHEADAISKITDAINGSSSTVGLTKDQINNVKNKYGHLNGFDEGALFEQTSKGVHLNQEEMTRLNKEYEKSIKLDIVQQLKKQKSALKEVNSELKTATGEQRVGLLQQKESILDNIRAIKQQASEFDGLTSAVAKWQNATSTANEGAIYDSIKDYKKTAAELAKNQQFGTDDMRRYVGMLTGKDMSAGMATVAEVKKAYNDLKTNVIPGTKHTMMSFFTDGTSGCIDYLKTLQSINKEWASQDKNGVWKINYNSEDVAKKLGTDASVVDAITEKLSEFMDVDMADHEKSIKDYINDVHTLDKQIKKLTGNKESVHIDIRTDNRTIPELETQLAEAKKEIKRINKLNLEPKVKDKMIVSATKKTKILIRKLAELKMPTSIKVDTSNMDKGWQDAYKALQDYWNAYYSHSQMPNNKAFTKDLDDAKAKLNGLEKKYKEGLNLKIKVNDHIDFEDLNKKLDGNNIKRKSKSKVTTTAEFDSKEATKNADAYKNKIEEVNKTPLTPKKAVADTYQAETNLRNLKTSIDNLPSTKHISIEGKVDVFSDVKGKVKGDTGNGGNPKSNHRISGHQQAGGTDNAAPGKTLVGELGQELVCRNGEYFTVGDNGPEMVNLHRGDIVFNADQTKDLLKKGQTSTLGKSLATGNAHGLSFASGNNTGSGAIVDTHTSSTSSKNKKKKKKSGNKKGKEKKAQNKEKKTAEFFDWIETKISRIERRITNVSKIAEQTYRSIRTREKEYKKELKLLAEQRKTEKKASAYYFKRANSVKLSKDYKKKVREGKIDIESIKDDKLKEKINRYKELYENGLKAKDAIADLNDTIQQTKTAILEMRISLLTAKKSVLEAKQTIQNDKYENAGTYGWNGEKDINSHYAYLKKTYKAQLVYSKETVKAYLKERKLVKKGSVAYAELTQKIYEARQEQNKLNTSIKNIPIDRLTAQFERINKLYEIKSNTVQQKLSLLKNDSEIEQALGHRLGSQYYKSTGKQIKVEKNNTKSQLDEINKIIAKATKENSDNPSFFKSEKYLAYIQQRNQLENQYLDYQKQEIDNNNALRQLEWDRFDRVQDMVEDVNKESSFLIDTITSERQLYDKYTGKGNKYEQAITGLHVASYETYKARSQQYDKEIATLKEQVDKDPANTTLKDRYRSLIAAQQEVLSNMETEKKSLKDMVQNEYNSILNAMKKIIDAKKQELSVEKNVYDYNKNVAKQSRQIAIYQKELAAYKGDNSEENKARVQKLNQQLRDAQESLDSTEYDKMISDQTDMLDNLYNDFELYFNNQMLQDLDDIISKEFTQVNSNTDKINETVSSTASSIGYDISNLSDVFASGGTFDIKIDTINDHLKNILSAIEKSVDSEESDTDKTANGFDKDNNKQDKNVDTINNDYTNVQNRKKNRDAESIQAAKQKTATAKEAVTQYNDKINNAKQKVKKLEDKMKNYSKSSSKYKELDAKKTSYSKKIEDMRNERDTIKKVYLAWSDLVTKMEKQKTAGAATDLLEKALSQNKYKIPNIIASNGFAKGGTIGTAIKATGEDGFVLARTGEEILSLEKIQELKKALSLVTPLSKLGKNNIVNAAPNTKNFNISNNNEFTFELNGVEDFDSFINKVQSDKRFEKIVQQMTIGTAMGDNTLNKYKY